MAKFAVPTDEEVLAALREVLGTRRVVNSQRELKALLQRQLGATGDKRVSGPRARLLAMRSGLIELQVHCREMDGVRSLFVCPVCGHRLKRLRNMTVFGGSVTIGYRCTKCPYWSGMKRRVPTRYVFTRR